MVNHNSNRSPETEPTVAPQLNVRSFEPGPDGTVDYPPGVPTHTYDFLIVASQSGAMPILDSLQRGLLKIYYGTDITLSGNIPDPRNRERAELLLRSSVQKLWQSTSPSVQQTFPLAELKLLKASDDPEEQARAAARKAKNAKISQSLKGKPSPLIGRKLTPEHKRKIAVGNLARRAIDPTYSRRTAEALRGRPSPLKGTKRSAETIAKIIQGQTAAWQRRRADKDISQTD